jgi:hypothetical protein
MEWQRQALTRTARRENTEKGQPRFHLEFGRNTMRVLNKASK